MMRKSVRAAALLICLAVGAGLLLEPVRRWRAEAAAAASRRLYEDFGCERSKPVPVRLNVNLLENPGLEGPCGWSGKPFKRAWIASSGSRSGKYHFRIKRKSDSIWQTIDLTPLDDQLEGNCCAVTISGFLKSEGHFGKGPYGHGNPYLYLTRTNRDGGSDWSLNPPGRVDSPEWESRTSWEWLLPSDTRSVTIMLLRWAEDWPSNAGHFDDLSLVVHPRGRPPPERSLRERE